MTAGRTFTDIRDEFWERLTERLVAAGFRPSHRANYCYLRLGVADTQLVLTAPTREGGVECKLSLAGARRAGLMAPEEVLERLRQDRDAIELALGYGRLEWGSATSATRVYLRRPANLSDRRTWDETIEWLINCAERFVTVFRPRLAAITAEAAHKPGPVGNDADGLALHARLANLAGRLGLWLKRPVSPFGEAWSLEAPPEPSGTHLHRYAYGLWWRPAREPRLDEMVAWVMLNPSTGDTDNTPRTTLGYCRNRTRLDWKYGGLLILNLFAYRATQPRDLYALPRDVCVGPVNDEVLSDLAPRCALAVAAWGHHGAQHGRSREVKALLPELQAIVNRDGRLTGDGGEPSHPRWLPRIPVLYPLSPDG